MEARRVHGPGESWEAQEVQVVVAEDKRRASAASFAPPMCTHATTPKFATCVEHDTTTRVSRGMLGGCEHERSELHPITKE
jgi:hypothetical protein